MEVDVILSPEPEQLSMLNVKLVISLLLLILKFGCENWIFRNLRLVMVSH